MSNKLSRRQVREKAVQTIYQLIRPKTEVTAEEALAFALDAGNDPEAGFGDVRDAYLKRLVEGVVSQQALLDERIEQFLQEDWSIERIARIDLAILRLAFYEVLFVSDEEVPVKVTVNEAVELAKTFSDDKSKQFINGVLAKLIVSLEEV